MAKKYNCTFFSEMNRYLFWRCVIAELFASTLYCFLTSSLIFNLPQTNVDNVANQVHFLSAALGIGFVVSSISYGFSVAHNTYIFPAVTIGQCLMRNCSFLQSFFHFLVQMIGGTLFYITVFFVLCQLNKHQTICIYKYFESFTYFL